MFTEIEQYAINEKLRQLREIKEGISSPKKLANLITQRRVSWFEANKDVVLKKYNDLPDDEKAYRIICLDHMKINPKHSIINRIDENKIRLYSYNFCPYLEACNILGLDTKFICKEVGELSIQTICEMINPRLMFNRNYRNIRPENPSFCEEYFEIK